MIWVQLKNTRPAMIIELLFCSFPLVDVSTSPSAFLHASCGHDLTVAILGPFADAEPRYFGPSQ